MRLPEHSRVDYTEIGSVQILTVRVGSVTAFPQLFETTIFKGLLNKSSQCYDTLEEAKQGHRDAVEKVKLVCKCGKPGRSRIDYFLACGIHCDKCFDKMSQECRNKSW